MRDIRAKLPLFLGDPKRQLDNRLVGDGDVRLRVLQLSLEGFTERVEVYIRQELLHHCRVLF
jgi:hypothetical protein